MHKRRTTHNAGWLVLLVLVVASLVTPGSPGVARAADCPRYFLAPSVAMCYPPSRVKDVERKLSVIPLNPTVAVRKVTGLLLTGVAFTTWHLPVYSSPRRDMHHSIAYMYGLFANSPLCVAAACPPWVVVHEGVGHDATLKGFDLTNIELGRWELRGNVPDRNLFLTIDAYLPKTRVLAIAGILLSQAITVRLGKPLKPPKLTEQQAIAVAAAHLGEDVHCRPHTVQFGSLREHTTIVDVWAVRVTALSSPLHVALVIIDDQKGAVIQVLEY